MHIFRALVTRAMCVCCPFVNDVYTVRNIPVISTHATFKIQSSTIDPRERLDIFLHYLYCIFFFFYFLIYYHYYHAAWRTRSSFTACSDHSPPSTAAGRMTSGDDQLRPIGATTCPPATRRTLHSSSSAVKKVDDGVTVWGVTVRSNCQIALPVFGTLFLVVGIVLTGMTHPVLPLCYPRGKHIGGRRSGDETLFLGLILFWVAPTTRST